MTHSSRALPTPSRFTLPLDPHQLGLFSAGEHSEIQRLLGAHPLLDQAGSAQGVRFSVWAPSASAVSVVGSFNDWRPEAHPLSPQGSVGIWSTVVDEAKPRDLYQFAICDAQGEALPWRADPVAFEAELAPKRASVVSAPSRFRWSDQQWLEERAQRQGEGSPISVYELHAGSWRRHPDGRPYGYQELAQELIPYVQALGFTHIELMPLTEYPFEGSWGYQTLGLFAPTCRYGTPDDLRALIDACHQASIGVILDWVPGHFPLDEHGLARFDGSALYEHEDPRRGLHPDWGTALYQYGRWEVRDFLISSALHWLDSFHFDALRVDAVASMLYLDYSRKEGEWVPNERGGREHLEAIDFLQRLNRLAQARCPGALVIAEESTSWPQVTGPVEAGGLGFDVKWNMGWMNDTLRYIQEDPVHRKWHHDKLTFGLVYGFSERFMLPISHDEVVHGKGSLWSKMPGDDWQKFANLRAYLTWMWTHPGQKLLFMGAELAQAEEWNHDAELSWGGWGGWRPEGERAHGVPLNPTEELNALSAQPHGASVFRRRGVARLLSRLNMLYRERVALHGADREAGSFEWLLADDRDRSVVSFIRRAHGQTVWVIINFTPVPRLGERMGVSAVGLELLVNTDDVLFGGSGLGPTAGQTITSNTEAWQGQERCVTFDLPPLGALIFAPVGETNRTQGRGSR